MNTQQSVGPLLRLPSVLAQTGLSKTEIYRRIRQGRFPQPRRLGPRTVAWTQASIEAYVSSLALRGEK
jgi:prophage regulatory protein